MARRNRETLKNYFRQGKRPGEQEFEDLIDSSLNTLDDGFSGSPQIGIGLMPITEKGTVISVFRGSDDTKAIWEIAIDKENADMQIRRCGEGKVVPVATFKYQNSQLGGAQEIIFDSIITSKGHKGCFKTGTVPADGYWHDIISEEDRLDAGCWAFEIVAGCGERHNGRYALMVATAMHCFGNKPKIHTVQSYYGQWGNRIRLRWKKIKGTYEAKLQIKTHFRYGDDVYIRYQISNLWDNPLMIP